MMKNEPTRRIVNPTHGFKMGGSVGDFRNISTYSWGAKSIKRQGTRIAAILDWLYVNPISVLIKSFDIAMSFIVFLLLMPNKSKGEIWFFETSFLYLITAVPVLLLAWNWLWLGIGFPVLFMLNIVRHKYVSRGVVSHDT